MQVERIGRQAAFVAALLCAGCESVHLTGAKSEILTSERAAAVKSGVREFMGGVAQDVTREGPLAWRKHFADAPEFFMAVDGRLQFANGAAAAAGIQELTRAIKQIELHWGDDLRVDPLTAELAVVAASWHEVIVTSAGPRVEANGFFTGTAEYREGRWKFRNAHWSTAAPRSSPP